MTWLHGVVQTIGEQHHQQRIGIIGNCMIGTIPLALFDLPQVGAGGGFQPALPMRFWWYTEADEESLGLSTDDLQRARQSAAKIYGLRFETDCISDSRNSTRCATNLVVGLSVEKSRRANTRRMRRQSSPRYMQTHWS